MPLFIPFGGCVCAIAALFTCKLFSQQIMIICSVYFFSLAKQRHFNESLIMTYVHVCVRLCLVWEMVFNVTLDFFTNLYKLNTYLSRNFECFFLNTNQKRLELSGIGSIARHLINRFQDSLVFHIIEFVTNHDYFIWLNRHVLKTNSQRLW